MRNLFVLLLLASACARINPDEHAYYDQKSRMRHGIVPLPPTKTPTLGQKLDDSRVAHGEILYQQDCARCHGKTGLGDGPEASAQKHPPANLRKTVREVRRFSFYLSISQWEGSMPGWKHPYSSDDREDLVAYLETFR